MLRTGLIAGSGIVAIMLFSGCAPNEPNALDQLGTIDMAIKGEPFRLWIADENEERLRGLMFITAEQMADLPDGTRRGMLFIFPFEQHLSFWMKNTIIPLDVAYLDSQGRVVAQHTMAPLDDRLNQYPSREPARFAIEVNANVFADLGLEVGDAISIPSEALKQAR